MAGAIARELHLDDEAIRRVETAALLHDVGKIGVADDLLTMGELSAAQASEVRGHVVLGQQILASAGLEELMPAVRSHHERWDGSGYPDGLAGEEIPVEARLLAVCDAFDHLTADTGQRIALTSTAAVTLMETQAGVLFDPAIVSALRAVIARSDT